MNIYDLMKILREQGRSILKKSFLLSLLLIVLLLFRQPCYTSMALFQDEAPSVKMQSSLAPILRGLNRGQEEGHAMTRLKANAILEDVVSDLGLQIKKRELGLAQRPWINLRAEARRFLPDESGFHFSQVDFSGELPEHFSLHFLSNERFAVKDAMGIVLGAGTLGERFVADSFAFTLNQKPQKNVQDVYFTLLPKWKVTKKLKNKIRIRKNRDDLALLKLYCSYPNRHLTKQILQSLVDHYQQSLRKEKGEVASEQIACLISRKLSLEHEHQELLKSHHKNVEVQEYKEQKALKEKTYDPIFLARVEENLAKILDAHASKKNLEVEILLNQKMQKMLAQMIEDREVEANVRPLRSKLVDPPTQPVLPDFPLLLPLFFLSMGFFSVVQLLIKRGLKKQVL